MEKLTKYTQLEHLQKTNELVEEVNKLKPVATTGSYNDLTDVPVLDEEDIKNALGYTPLNADEGGDIGGDINVTNGGKYLVNGEELESGINLLKREKDYIVGDIAFSKELKSPYHLLCIQAGKTAVEEPELNSKILNEQFNDGTAKWQVVSYVNHLENYLFVGDKEDLDENKVHENLIVVSPEELLDPINSSAYTFIGASESIDGREGFVPAPEAGPTNRFLASDGFWKEVNTSSTSSATPKKQIGWDAEEICELNLEQVYDTIETFAPLTEWKLYDYNCIMLKIDYNYYDYTDVETLAKSFDPIIEPRTLVEIDTFEKDLLPIFNSENKLIQYFSSYSGADYENNIIFSDSSKSEILFHFNEYGAQTGFGDDGTISGSVTLFNINFNPETFNVNNFKVSYNILQNKYNSLQKVALYGLKPKYEE